MAATAAPPATAGEDRTIVGRRLTVAVDVDDVCARLGPAWVARYNERYGDSLTWEQVTDWDIRRFVKPACGARVYDLLTPDLYDTVEPDPVAKTLVEHIRAQGHRVVYVTSAMQRHAGRKLRWLREHGFLDDGGELSLDYIEATDKSLIAADILIDDKPANVRAFVDAGRVAVLWQQPHNTCVPTEDLARKRDGGLLDGRHLLYGAPSGYWYVDSRSASETVSDWNALLRTLAENEAAAPTHGPAPDDAPGESILAEADRIVSGDRGDAYGHPHDDFTRTARMWCGYLELPEGTIGPRDVAMMMVMVKASRERHRHKRDNLTDIAGYAKTAHMVAEREAELEAIGHRIEAKVMAVIRANGERAA